MNREETWYGPAYYQIKIKGSLGKQLSLFSKAMTSSYENGVTTITGKVIDQSELHGILNRIRDIGLQLISVQRIEHNQKCK